MTRAQRSLLIAGAENYINVALQLASTVIVARLLTPAQIGVFAIAAVFASLASSFRDFGVAEYMIQEKQLTWQKLRAAFGLNVLVSWSMAGLLVALSPVAARFYGESGVGEVMRIQALSFMLVPFGAITLAWYRRELRYAPIAVCNLLSGFTTAAVSVALAYLGFGYLSLAWGALAGIVAVVAAASWLRPAEVPRWPGLGGIGEVFRFGKYASGTYLVAQLSRGMPELMLGRIVGAEGVGLFSRANGLVEIFNRLTLNPLIQICMPYFAQQQREQGSIAAAYTRGVGLLTAAGWPFLAAMAVLAFPAIRIIYGDQWLAAVAFAQLLCLAGAVEISFFLTREALMARGQVRRTMAMQIQLLVLRALGLLAAVPFGLPGACWGLVASACAGFCISLWHLRTVQVTPAALWPVLSASLGLTIGVAAPLALAAWQWPPDGSNYIRWALAGGAYVLGAWLLGLWAMRHPLWHEVQRVATPLLRRWRRDSQNP